MTPGAVDVLATIKGCNPMFIEIRRSELHMTGNGKVTLLEWDCGPDGVEIYAFDNWKDATRPNAPGLVQAVFRYADLAPHHSFIVRHNSDALSLYYQLQDTMVQKVAEQNETLP